MIAASQSSCILLIYFKGNQLHPDNVFILKEIYITHISFFSQQYMLLFINFFNNAHIFEVLSFLPLSGSYPHLLPHT